MNISDRLPVKLSIKDKEEKRSVTVNETSEYITPTISENKYVSSSTKENSTYDRSELNGNASFYHTSHEDTFDEYCSPTPPLSRTGYYSSRSRSRTPSVSNFSVGKSYCNAKTRLGTPCKLSCLPGRDFCHRHMRGDSLMG